jgi:hypothetical protein
MAAPSLEPLAERFAAFGVQFLFVYVREAHPVVAVGRDGSIRWFYTGKDFADRPLDAELFQALEG